MSKPIPTYNRRNVVNLISSYGIDPKCICLMDEDYVFIEDQKSPEFFFALSTQVIDTLKSWKAQSRDCDKFSRVVQALGQLSHAMQWDSKKAAPAGLALGVFNFRHKKIGPHSINCILTKQAGEDKFFMRFFEPQSAVEVFLTPEEIKSAFLILL
jgi:hypothetical protein